MTQLYAHQNAFNAGILSPTVFGRSDLTVYKSGLRRCENFLVLRPGGLERRPGSRFIAATKTPSERVRLFTFRFNDEQSYVISVSGTHLRFYTNDAPINLATHRVQAGRNIDILTDEIAITSHGYTNGLAVKFTPTAGSTLPSPLAAGKTYEIALPVSLTPNATTHVEPGGDDIDIIPTSLELRNDGLGEELTARMGPYRVTSTGNMPAGLNVGTDYYLTSLSTANQTFSLAETVGGSDVNITADGSGNLLIRPEDEWVRDKFRVRDPVTGRIVIITDVGTGSFDIEPVTVTPLELPSSYLESELRQIQFAQDKDVFYFAHINHPLRRLVRYGNATWELTDADLIDGPYLEVGETYPGVFPDGLTLSAAAATGTSIQLSASEAIFVPTDIGRHVRIGHESEADRWGWAKIVGLTGVSWTDADINEDASTARSGVQLTMTGHPFTNGEGPVRVSNGVMGLVVGTDYYLRVIDANTVSVHPTKADALANTNAEPLAAHVSENFVSSWLNITGHGFTADEGPVTLANSAGSLPTAFSSGTDYYIVLHDADHISLSLTAGGAAIAIPASDGSGTHTINGGLAPQVACFIDIQPNESDATLGLPTTNATTNWRLGAFGDDSRLGWPGAVTLHEQRLVLAGAPGTPQTVYGSRSQDQLNFAPDDDDPTQGAAPNQYDRILNSTSAYTYQLNSEDLNVINWLRPVRILFAAGLGGIHHMSGASIAEAITPTNVNAKRGTPIGAAPRSPITFDTAVVFIEESQRTLQRAEFRPDLEAIETQNLLGLSDHLVSGTQTLLEITRVQNPLPVVWTLRSDGALLAITLDSEQRVAAWSTHTIAGTNVEIESITALPDAQDGELWMSVKRDVNGSTVRHIERLEARFSEGDDQALYHAFDGGPAAYDGVEVAAGGTFTIDAAFAGETFSVLADGGEHAAVTIGAGGTFTLTRAASKVVVGYPFIAEAEGLPPVPDQQQLGSDLSNRPVRVVDIRIRLNRAGGIEVGRTTANLALLPFRDVLDPMDTPTPLFTGVKVAVINGTYDEDDAWVIRAQHPVPAQILSVTPRLDFPNLA